MLVTKRHILSFCCHHLTTTSTFLEQAKQVEPPDCHICKFLPSGNLVRLLSGVSVECPQSPCLHASLSLLSLLCSFGGSKAHMQQYFRAWCTCNHLWSCRTFERVACTALQVCFGNMQHEIVMYSYKGPGQGVKGDVDELPLEEGLPFSR